MKWKLTDSYREIWPAKANDDNTVLNHEAPETTPSKWTVSKLYLTRPHMCSVAALIDSFLLRMFPSNEKNLIVGESLTSCSQTAELLYIKIINHLFCKIARLCYGGSFFSSSGAFPSCASLQLRAWCHFTADSSSTWVTGRMWATEVKCKWNQAFIDSRRRVA